MKKSDRSFWLFVAVIAGIMGLIMLINSFSPVSVKELTEETEEHIKAAEKTLETIQGNFEEYGRLINRFAEKCKDESLLQEEIEALEKELLINNPVLLGVYYEIAWEDSEHILVKYMDRNGTFEVPLSEVVNFPENMNGTESDGMWRRALDRNSNEESFLYIQPVFRQGEPIGYIGMLLSADLIREQIEAGQESRVWEYHLLADEAEAEQVLEKIDRKAGQIDTVKVLSTGMIYIEIYPEAAQVRHSNEMILLVSLFAIAAMWMIQGKDKNGRTVFDKCSDWMMKGYADKLDPAQRQGYRATIALNIGMAAAIFADVIYSITLGRGGKTVFEYLLFLGLACSALVLYKLSKNGITKKMAMGIITIGLLGPLAEHIISGGFAMGRTGESFLWFIICLYTALFILGSAQAVYVLSAFVMLLFLDVILEIVLFQKTNYEGSYLFVISFILLGFALYNAMEIYVTGAAGHYIQTQRLIEELKKNQDLLIQKEKLGALGQLISGVAQEINAPMEAIKTSAEKMDNLFPDMLREILDTAGEEAAKGKDFVSKIPIVLKASEDVAQIVLALKSYLYTSPIEENVEFDLNRCVDNVLILFGTQLKDTIKVNRNYEKNPCVITGNPGELAQVCTNLIQNAIYAMGDGGELTIGIKETGEETVEISVRDTGKGIAPEMIGQIYEPFFTTAQSGKGNGLGLSIAKKIIERHKGEMTVESQLGRGTIFHVRLNKICEL